MKKALADVLWNAANKHMCSDRFERDKQEYSCHAAYDAIGGGWTDAASETYDFFQSLGCSPDACGTEVWDCWEGRQGIRYMWLLLAMHVAEDENIHIEVS